MVRNDFVEQVSKPNKWENLLNILIDNVLPK